MMLDPMHRFGSGQLGIRELGLNLYHSPPTIQDTYFPLYIYIKKHNK